MPIGPAWFFCRRSPGTTRSIAGPRSARRCEGRRGARPSRRTHKERRAMSVQTLDVKSSGPNEHGYRSFSLGELTFSRDEYFVYVKWPTGRHVMSADAFLRSLQRDVAWEFFYGIVNFDGVIGTVNHYGTVDLFAGRYNDAYRKTELAHRANFATPRIKGTCDRSAVSACKSSLYCPTTEEYILPIVHGNARVAWFVNVSDEIYWDVEDRDKGAVRAKVVMKPGDVAAMPADIRHQGYSPKRAMLLVWENGSPDIPALIASGKAPTNPVSF